MKKAGVFGADLVAKVLNEMAPRHANNIMKATVHAIAGEAKKRIKKRLPKDFSGDLRKSLKHKRRQALPMFPVSDVYVERGVFYWRFLEHGTKATDKHGSTPAVHFVRNTEFEMSIELPKIGKKLFLKKLEAANKRALKKRVA